MSKGSKKAILRDLENNDKLFDFELYHYYDNETDTMLLNDLRIKADRYNHKLENLIYTKGIEVIKAYQQQGFNMVHNEYLKAESDFNSIVANQDFKAYCLAYKESKEKPFFIGEPFFGCTEKMQCLIISAFEKLGYNRIVELKFHQTNIKKHLATALSFNTYAITKAIYRAFKTGERYKTTDMKIKIQSIYDSTGTIKKATATKIDEYFEKEPCKMPDKSNGFILGQKLIKITDSE